MEVAELREEVVARLWDWVDYTSTISDGKKKSVYMGRMVWTLQETVGP